MDKTFLDLLKEKKIQNEALGENTNQEVLKAEKLQEDLLHEMLVGKLPQSRSIRLSEAIMTRDFPQLLQRVINDRLLTPIEPEYIGQTLLATTINVNRTIGTYTMPSFGFVTAQEMAEGQEFAEVVSEFNKNVTSIMIRKFGVEVGISAEMLEADELGLYGMHITAAKIAMNRKKEEVIFELFMNSCQPGFDNEIAWPNTLKTASALSTIATGQEAFATNGLGADGEKNGTLSIFDIIDVLAVLLSRGYEPSDILVNPLAWSVFARTPIMNGFHPYVQATGSTMTPMYTSTGPGDFSKVNMPWGITMHVSKFVPVTRATTAGLPKLTNIYIGSRKNGVLLLQGRGLQQEAYRSIERDIFRTRLKEYYGVGLADAGRSWMSIKNIRIDNSYDFVITKTIS